MIIQMFRAGHPEDMKDTISIVEFICKIRYLLFMQEYEVACEYIYLIDAHIAETEKSEYGAS